MSIYVYEVCVWTNMYFTWEKRGLSNFPIDYLLNSIKKNIRLAYKRNIVVIYIDWNIVRFYLLTGSLFPFKIVQIRMKCECVRARVFQWEFMKNSNWSESIN